MQRENEAPSMAGQSASGASSDHRPDNLLEDQRNHDIFVSAVTKRTYPDDGTSVSTVDNQRGDHVLPGPASNDLKRELDDRFVDIVRDREISGEIDLEIMKQSDSSAKNRLDNLVRERRSAAQTASHYSVNPTMSKVQFRDDRVSDNEASSAILDKPRQSASNSAKSSVHDRNAKDASMVEVPIDRSRESSSVNHLTGSTRSRRDRNEASFDGTERADLSIDNVFGETSVNRANKRTSDYSVQRSLRGDETLSRPNEHDINVAAKHRYDSAPEPSNRKTVGFEATTQTHLHSRNIHPLNNPSDGARESESTTDYLNESNNFDANESENLSKNDSDIDAIAVVDVSATVLVENQIDGISEIENQTETSSPEYIDNFSDISGAEVQTTTCHDNVCSESSDSTDITVIRREKFGGEKELSDNREDESGDEFAQISGVSTTMPGNDSDTDIDGEAPFTGFEGSQKFPVKINHKSPPVVPQVEKFDRRHFGRHKEDTLEETTEYSSTVLPDLPKSPSRDVLHRHHKSNDNSDDVEVGKEDDRDAETIERDEKRNDTLDESELPGASSGRRSPTFATAKPDYELTATSNTVDSDIENATRNKSDFDVGIDVTVPAAKSIEKTNITILGLFEMTRGTMPRPEGSTELEAAKLAVDRVNELNILKRFRLRLIYNDTKVSCAN